MTSQQRAALGVAVLVLLILAIAAVMHHREWMTKHCICNKLINVRLSRTNPLAHHLRGPAEAFSGDTDNWPGSGTFGALADTFPYGNYADGLQTFYPTFDEYNPYWTRS